MQKNPTGVVLMNLGSPDSTNVPDVRRYLNEFLMDERVIDVPKFFRTILVKGIISPLRAPKSARVYKSIWWQEGSPLIQITRRLQKALQAEIPEMPIEIAMRYGNPSVKLAFDNLQKNHPNLKEVVAVPLYPHYAMSSYESAVEDAKTCHKNGDYTFDLKIVPPFYKDENYINALAKNIQPYLEKSKWDYLLFSYHGIPERHIRKSDPTKSHCQINDTCCSTPSPAHQFCYKHQDITTMMLTAAQLGLPKNKFGLSFQSRIGGGWLKPFTDVRLKEMPKEGIKNLLIVCPAFVSDCLETLEEIEIAGKETFLKSGGESYTMIPCLNDSPLFVKTLAHLIGIQQNNGDKISKLLTAV